jgi:hypothetical protein
LSGPDFFPAFPLILSPDSWVEAAGGIVKIQKGNSDGVEISPLVSFGGEVRDEVEGEGYTTCEYVNSVSFDIFV